MQPNVQGLSSLNSPGNAAVFVDPFTRAFDSMNKAIDQTTEGFQQLVDRVNKYRWWLLTVGLVPGGAAIYWIHTNVEKIKAAIEKIMEKIKYAVNHQMPVLSLMQVSFGWINEVQSPISNLSAATTEPRDLNLANWMDAAGRTYRERVKYQEDGVNEAAKMAGFVSKWLMDIAKSNVEFATSLAQTATKIAGAITQALIEAASVIDIPWAISTAAGVIGTIVEDGLNALLNIANRFMEAASNVRDMTAVMNDGTVFQGGKWPETVRG